MRLSFHQRILLILICLGAAPTAAAILGWGLTIRSATPVAGPRQALEEVGATGRALLRALDTTHLAPDQKAALSAHAGTLNTAIGQFQRAETYGRYYYAGLGLAVFLLGAAALYASVRLGGHLSRQLSRPIEELIGWTGHIRRMEPLPPDRPRRGAPEFTALRTALREFTEFGRLPEGPAAAVDLVELLEELARTSIPPTMTGRLALDPSTPVVQGHYDPLRRAFSNIIRNAVEACGGEGEIEISATPDSGGALVVIRDHGPGIPPDIADRIFDPYCTGKEGGTGLGLALARQTVELHRGTISAERTPGGGATFVVRLGGL